MTTPVRIFRLPGVPAVGAGLPKMITYGFSDDFARADGPLTAPWEQFSGAGSAWGITGGQARLESVTAPDTRAYAVIDAGRADGRLTVVAGSTWLGSGIAVRVVNSYNNLTLLSASGKLLLRKLVAASTTTLAESAPGTNAVPGDVIEIAIAGPDIRVFRNGTQVIAVTDAAHATATRHGLFALAADPGARFSSARFSPS